MKLIRRALLLHCDVDGDSAKSEAIVMGSSVLLLDETGVGVITDVSPLIRCSTISMSGPACACAIDWFTAVCEHFKMIRHNRKTECIHTIVSISFRILLPNSAFLELQIHSFWQKIEAKILEAC